MMTITKYTRVEDTQVISPKGHKAIEEELHKQGKTSARVLSEEERTDLRSVVDSDDSQ